MKIKQIKNQDCNLHILENLETKYFKSKRIFFLQSKKTYQMLSTYTSALGTCAVYVNQDVFKIGCF